MKDIALTFFAIVTVFLMLFAIAKQDENRAQRLEICAKNSEVTMLKDSINLIQKDFDYFNNYTAILEKKVLKVSPSNKDFDKVNSLIEQGKYKNLIIF